ncbi:MAG: ATP-binding protein, partial [Alcanivoracaceae bacterium]|nr:ATP-binding protein [Alcanivoracaceae bacterium]
RIPADLCVEANDAELSEVLAILLDNAIQFSEDGSEVRAEARFEEEGGHVVLCVADSGRGIAAEALQSIFEPFFMVGSNHRVDGFGLSLPTARVMVEQIGGQIWAESAGRGRGACLCIRLRVAAG